VSFAEPLWLSGALAALLVLPLIWRWHDKRQRIALARFVAPHLQADLTRSISTARRRAQRGLFLLAVVLLCVALAGPLVGFRWEQISRRGNEIVFAIDTSRSMTTPDVKPDRLTRAKLAIDDFANRLDGDAVGIVAFAGSAYLVCPITLDYGAFHETLAAIDTHTVERGGTNIASAIREAQAALRRRPGSDKILILVTDGEDLEGDALTAAQTAKAQDGMRIYTVGVGTSAGDLIPLPPDQGGGFVKDENGQYVKSRLDEPALSAIAAATGGFYVPLGAQGEGLDTIAKSVLGSLVKHDLAARQRKVYIERYQWPLGAALASLLGSLMIGSRRRVKSRTAVRTTAPAPRAAPPAAAPSATAALALALLLPMLFAAGRARAAGAGPNPDVIYNQGTQEYRAGRFDAAAKDFKQSIEHTPSSEAKRLADQEDAYYNLGNALYRNGQKSAKASPDDTIKTWTEAVKAYETALQLRANDADSKYNRDLVKRKIEELKQQQQQQQQQQNKNQNQDKDQKQNQGQGKDPGQSKNPPPGQGQPQGQGQPPPKGPDSAGNKPPPGQQPQPGQKPPGQGQPQPQPGQPPQTPPDQQADADARAADNEHAPGQMSREEARELLDSAKGDEKHPPGTPLARNEAAEPPPDKPYKNW
jgi:Ca-activated chloride channel family protein